MKRPQAQWTLGTISVASLAVLAMHAYLGTYSRFIADDYCSAGEARRLGILRAAWYWYRNWNGRYSANVLDALFGRLGPDFTPAVTALVLLVWLAVLAATIFLLVTQVSATSSPLLLSVALAAAILFLTLGAAPNVAQALYWGQGMRSIVPPLILMVVYAGLFLCLRRGGWPRGARWLWMGLSFALAYGAGGFSETYTALQVAALVLTLAVWMLLSRRTLRGDEILFLSAGLVGAALSFVTIIFSPGNAARAAFYPPHPQLPALIGIALRSFGLFLQQMLSSGPRLLSLIAAALLGIWIGASFEFRIPEGRVSLLILVLGAMLCFSCFPPAAYGLSDAPPDRTLLIPTFLLVMTLVTLGISSGGWLAARWQTLPLVSSAAILVLVAAAVMSILQLSALQPEYAAYANAWGQFHAEMVGFRQAGVTDAQITTEAMNANNWLGLNVLGDNPKFWLNQCVSQYYGVQVISTSP